MNSNDFTSSLFLKIFVNSTKALSIHGLTQMVSLVNFFPLNNKN